MHVYACMCGMLACIPEDVSSWCVPWVRQGQAGRRGPHTLRRQPEHRPWGILKVGGGICVSKNTLRTRSSHPPAVFTPSASASRVNQFGPSWTTPYHQHSTTISATVLLHPSSLASPGVGQAPEADRTASIAEHTAMRTEHTHTYTVLEESWNIHVSVHAPRQCTSICHNAHACTHCMHTVHTCQVFTAHTVYTMHTPHTPSTHIIDPPLHKLCI